MCVLQRSYGQPNKEPASETFICVSISFCDRYRTAFFIKFCLCLCVSDSDSVFDMSWTWRAESGGCAMSTAV